MINVTVIPSNDPPEVVKKRLEEAVRVFFLSVEKEKAHRQRSHDAGSRQGSGGSGTDPRVQP